MARGRELEMTSGAILPRLLQMAIPLILSSILQLLFNAADIVVVGNFGSEHSLAAVGSTFALMNLITTVFLGLSLGANKLVAYYWGATDYDRVARTVHSSIVLGALGGVFMFATAYYGARTILIWMQTPIEALDLATQYLRVCAYGMVAVTLYNFGAAILRAKGDTQRPLIYIIIAGAVNVVLNVVFVVSYKLDVKGVALATVLSQYLSAFLVLWALARETDAFRLQWRKLRLETAIVWEILRVGVPAGVQGVVFSLSNVVIQSAVNGFGPIVMAGSAAAASIEAFVWMSMNAFTQCALTFTSQNVGAKRYDRVGKVCLCCCASTFTVGVIAGNLAYLFGPMLLNLFDHRSEVIDAGMTRLFMVCCFYAICGLMDCLIGVIRGLGYNVTPTIIALVGACGLRLIWIGTLFQIPRFHTVASLFLTYPASWLATLAAAYCFYVYVRRAEPCEEPDVKISRRSKARCHSANC
ncbi:MAG: MATE family efflux transporter [Planctomycetia bacterium]|nr:MATE family efflux transporter [Planctomycetia bacterium]